ncbi:hypothetical protein KIN20_012504 [Parelaphostrongylus tenuis]|uniref:Uncharacterized protein n=1 Tax=Parelaphostrongylus tenuis TaxID=148309 RepID=A0AAD5QMV4_PARTN|nr:hypothetical protein KIN20_012504 [Parelaphostrongylus tenuis]
MAILSATLIDVSSYILHIHALEAVSSAHLVYKGQSLFPVVATTGTRDLLWIAEKSVTLQLCFCRDDISV